MRCALVFLIVLGSAGAITAASAADDNSSLGACAAVTGDLDRLQCYDNLAKKAGVAPRTEQAQGEGEWQLQTNIDPVDDSRTVVLMSVAKNARASLGRPIVLFLRCKSHHPDAFINWNDFLGEGGTTLTIRFGEQTAASARWPLSTDNLATFVPDAVQFMGKLEGVNQLVAQVTPYNASPVTAIFNTSDLKDAIKPLAEECKLKI